MLFSIKISAFNEYENKMIKIKCLSCFLFYNDALFLCCVIHPSIHLILIFPTVHPGSESGGSIVSRDTKTSLPDTSSDSSVGTKMCSQASKEISPSCPGSSLGPSPGRSGPKSFIDEMQRHPSQIPKPPQMGPFDVND